MSPPPAVADRVPVQEPVPAPGKPRWWRWLLAGLALVCCCGAPVAWVPLAAIDGGRQVTGLHDRLHPGMSAAQVIERIGEVRLSNVGLSRIFLFPQSTSPTDKEARQGSDACPVDAPLVWNPSGGPSIHGLTPERDVMARRLATCDALELRFVVFFSRYEFVVALKDGTVSEVTAAQGHLD